MNTQFDGIVMSRVFNAPRELVWNAWTKPDMVKKWWGPKDFAAPSIVIDFRVGGKYIYCMHGPKGTQFDIDMYSAGVFKEIVPIQKLTISDYFSDKDGNKIDPASMGLPKDMPVEMDVMVLFEDAGTGKTKLSIIYPRPASDAQFSAMKKSGLEEGWGTSLDKLAESLRLEPKR
jgi:uncharacterized protein YndB with AHSA1/START domain